MRRLFSLLSLLVLFLSVHTQDVAAQSVAIQPTVDKLVEEICSDGGMWLRCYSLPPSRCREVTAGFVQPCVERVMATPIAEPAEKGVARLLSCFNERFMAKYGLGEVKSPECKNPMKHLSKSR